MKFRPRAKWCSSRRSQYKASLAPSGGCERAPAGYGESALWAFLDSKIRAAEAIPERQINRNARIRNQLASFIRLIACVPEPGRPSCCSEIIGKISLSVGDLEDEYPHDLLRSFCRHSTRRSQRPRIGFAVRKAGRSPLFFIVRLTSAGFAKSTTPLLASRVGVATVSPQTPCA